MRGTVGIGGQNALDDVKQVQAALNAFANKLGFLPLQVDGVYLIDDYPDVNDKDEEVYPEMAVLKGLSYLYSGQQLADVVRNVTGQIKNPKINEFKLALDFYSKNDNFMNFPGE